MRWWRIQKRDADLDRELRSDLELEEEEQRERGLSPEEAPYAARRAFGNTALIREQTHEAWGWAPVERFGQDVRYGWRQLLRSPGFTITALLILALGIGAVTAVFSLIDAALLKMLPVKDAEQLVDFKNVNPGSPVNDAFSYHTFKAIQNETRVLAGTFAFRKLHNIDVEVDGRSELAEGQLVSGSSANLIRIKLVRLFPKGNLDEPLIETLETRRLAIVRAAPCPASSPSKSRTTSWKWSCRSSSCRSEREQPIKATTQGSPAWWTLKQWKKPSTTTTLFPAAAAR